MTRMENFEELLGADLSSTPGNRGGGTAVRTYAQPEHKAGAALEALWAAASEGAPPPARRTGRAGRPVTMRLPANLDDALDAYVAAGAPGTRTRTSLVVALLDAYLRDTGVLLD